MDGLLGFILALADLVPVVGFGAGLIAVIVDALKRFGLLPDGFAPLAASLLNVALFAIVYFVGDQADIEGLVEAITALAPYIIGLLSVALAAPAVHNALERVGVGFSHKSFPGAAG